MCYTITSVRSKQAFAFAMFTKLKAFGLNEHLPFIVLLVKLNSPALKLDVCLVSPL